MRSESNSAAETDRGAQDGSERDRTPDNGLSQPSWKIIKGGSGAGFLPELQSLVQGVKRLVYEELRGIDKEIRRERI